jgi:hypothetical protein
MSMAVQPLATIARSKRLLYVLGETLIHPWWERAVTGAPIGRTPPEQLSTVQRVLTWKSLQQHRNANPRDAAYMLDAAAEVLTDANPTVAVDVVMPAWMKPALADRALARFERCWAVDADTDWTRQGSLMRDLRARHYDAVVLLYPDGNGLGWMSLEQRLGRLGVPMVALNGRRRLFTFDKPTRRALRLRRALERSWLVEAAVIAGVVPIGLALAAYDAITLRQQHEWPTR